MDELPGRDAGGLGGLPQRGLGRRRGPLGLGESLEPAPERLELGGRLGLDVLLEPVRLVLRGVGGVGGQRAAHLDRRAHARPVQLDRAQRHLPRRARRPRRREARARAAPRPASARCTARSSRGASRGRTRRARRPRARARTRCSISARVRISRSPPGRPAQQREEVEERLGQDSGVAPLLDGGRAVPLRELLAVGAQDHPEVREAGGSGRRARGRARRAWACWRGGRRRG